mgnify:CR=1 FL=1
MNFGTNRMFTELDGEEPVNLVFQELGVSPVKKKKAKLFSDVRIAAEPTTAKKDPTIAVD